MHVKVASMVWLTMQQASSIANPVPLRLNQPQQLNNDLKTPDTGRDTPLPQYEKIQSMPFTLNLQEDARNPGQFQLVFNIGSKPQAQNGMPISNTPTPIVSTARKDGLKLDTEQEVIHQIQKPSPPSTPLKDQQGWADLDHVPPDFLRKVVPDWNVSFSRSGSTASMQSKRLSDIGAKIRKTGKGYVVRLLKRSAADTNEIAEVDLGQHAITERSLTEPAAELHEMDNTDKPAELENTECFSPLGSELDGDSLSPLPGVFEIGTSNEDGSQRPQKTSMSVQAPSDIPSLRHLSYNSVFRNSIAEEGLSDAETLIPDVRSINGRIDDDQFNSELFFRNTPTSPTRGLSIHAVRKRVEKRPRDSTKARATNLGLRRSDAQKSIKRRPSPTTTTLPDFRFHIPSEPSMLRERMRVVSRKSIDDDLRANELDTWEHPIRNTGAVNPRHQRHVSADDLQVPSVSKGRLRLQTNIPQAKSAQVSPMTRRRKSPRIRKSISSSASPIDPEDVSIFSRPEWTEVDPSDELRDALRKALGSAVPNIDNDHADDIIQNSTLPRIIEPMDDDHVGEIPFPSEVEIRSSPVNIRSSTLAYWGLALSALSDKAYEGFKLLRDAFGTELPVPKGHVRVRWTCVSVVLTGVLNFADQLSHVGNLCMMIS